MKKCTECGKELSLLEGHHNPSFGKRWLLCSNCYDKIEEKKRIKKKNKS